MPGRHTVHNKQSLYKTPTICMLAKLTLFSVQVSPLPLRYLSVSSAPSAGLLDIRSLQRKSTAIMEQ